MALFSISFHFPHPLLTTSSFDSIINDYLMKFCGRTPATSAENGIVVHSHCDFFGSVAYPSVIEAGMRVNKLGKTSVEYEVGIFEKGTEGVFAVGGFMHVFTDRATNRPMPGGMSPEIRKSLERLLVRDEGATKAKL